MNLADTIKEAILTGNWSLVCNVYEDLTGNVVAPPEQNNENDEILNSFLNLINLYKQKNQNIPKKEKQIPKPPTPPPNETMTRGELIPQKNSHYGNATVFVTEQTTAQEIEDNRVKNEISSTRKVKRSPSKKYDVTCNECEKQFKSDRSSAEEMGVKCPNCIRDLIKNKGKENDDPNNG